MSFLARKSLRIRTDSVILKIRTSIKLEVSKIAWRKRYKTERVEIDLTDGLKL